MELHAEPHDYKLEADALRPTETLSVPGTPGYLLAETGDLLQGPGSGEGYIWQQSHYTTVSYGLHVDPHDYEFVGSGTLPRETIDLPTLIAGDLLIDRPHQFKSAGVIADWDGEVDTGSSLAEATDPDRKEHGTVWALTHDDTTQAYLYDDLAGGIDPVEVRFWINLNDLAIDSGYVVDPVYVQTSGGAATPMFFRLYDSGGTMYVRLHVLNDSATHETCVDVAFLAPLDWLTDWQEVRILYGKATAPGANDGYGYLWIDEVLMGSQTNIDNDAVGDSVRSVIGIVYANSPTAPSGTFYLDDYSISDPDDTGDLLAETGDTLVLDASVQTTLTYKLAADPKFYILLANPQIPASPTYDDIEGDLQLEDGSGYLVQEDGTSKMIIWMRR